MGSPTIPIDPHGDLTLIVGADDDTKSFLVSSKVLSVASPVWRAMLSTRNGFKEAGSKEIDFPDDDPKALHIVLLACHLSFPNIPKMVDLIDLGNLCTICDKYDCISLIQPWFSAWASQSLDRVWENGYERWVFIAWVMGDMDVFKRATNRVVLKCRTNESGQCLSGDGRRVLDDPLTPGLADAILEARAKTLTRLIDACHTMVRKYVYSPNHHCRFGYQECDALVFGSLVKSLQIHRLWPGEPKHIARDMPEANVENILSKIKGMRSHVYPTTTTQPGIHNSCSFTLELNKTVDKIVENMGADVLEANRKHLEIRHAKLGS